jgi:uncharacterized membrane protein YtjA (UPF0391 family)
MACAKTSQMAPPIVMLLADGLAANGEASASSMPVPRDTTMKVVAVAAMAPAIAALHDNAAVLSEDCTISTFSPVIVVSSIGVLQKLDAGHVRVLGGETAAEVRGSGTEPSRHRRFVYEESTTRLPKRVVVDFEIASLSALQRRESTRRIKRNKLNWTEKKGFVMLNLAVTLLIIALIAALFGFGGIAVAAVGLAKIIFFVAIVLFLIAVVTGTLGRGTSL